MVALANQPQQSWRDRAIERSEGITDAWEVTKTYAGRIAEWVLFLCMIMNIVEVLVTLPSWLSSTIMGVQVVMLDVGGFSLASMADQARENGDEQAAKKARATGYLLIAIMIVTLLLVSVGILWPHLRDVTTGAEKGLILVRVVMTVVYGHVLHSLRRRTGAALNPTQVANVEIRMQEQVAQISATLREQVAQHSSQLIAHVEQSVTTQVAQNAATLCDTVASEVAKISRDSSAAESELSEQVGQLVGLTTVTEIRSFTQEPPALPQVATAIVDASVEPGDRVKAFLGAWNSPKKPTIQTIMDTCQVAKKTATRYRDDFYGVATGSQSDNEGEPKVGLPMGY